MLVPLGFPNTCAGSGSTLPDLTEKKCQRLGNQPDGGRLCRNGVPASRAWSGDPQKREHQNYRAAAGGHESAGESPVFESGGTERGEALQRAAQRRERRRPLGPWRKSRDDPNDSYCANNSGLLGLHNVSSGEKVQGLGPEEVGRPAAARCLSGTGSKVSTWLGGSPATTGRDLRCGDRRNAVMKRLFAAESLRWRILLRFAAWAVLIVLIFASAPFLFDVLSRGMEWIAGLFPILTTYGRSIHGVFDKRAVWFFLRRFFLLDDHRKNAATSACRRLGRFTGCDACQSAAGTGAREPCGSNSVCAERNQRPDQDSIELDQFGANCNQQFLPASDMARRPDQPGEGDGDADDWPVQKPYAEHFQHQPEERHVAQPGRPRERHAESPDQ